MLWSCSLTGPELRVALEGYDALTLLKHSCHYQQYIQENILEQVPTGAAEVYTPTFYSLFSLSLASCTDYHLQLALLLLMKLWRSKLILRGLRLLEPVIPSMLRLCGESLQLVPLLVIFFFWIDLCTTGLLLFRLLLSSILFWCDAASYLFTT